MSQFDWLLNCVCQWLHGGVGVVLGVVAGVERALGQPVEQAADEHVLGGHAGLQRRQVQLGVRRRRRRRPLSFLKKGGPPSTTGSTSE